MAKAKDKFGNGMVYEQFGDVYKPETGICPVCKTLWNSHNLQELERCRKINKLENKSETGEWLTSRKCLFCHKSLKYKGRGKRKMFCGYACKYSYYKKSQVKTCPSCHSKNIGLDGHTLKSHKQKYRCKDCKRKFQDSYKVKAFLNMRKSNLHAEQKLDKNNIKEHNLYHTIFKENLDVLTERDRADNYKYLRILSNPLCYKCKKHTQKKSFSKGGHRIYFCPRCKIRFFKLNEKAKQDNA